MKQKSEITISTNKFFKTIEYKDVNRISIYIKQLSNELSKKISKY